MLKMCILVSYKMVNERVNVIILNIFFLSLILDEIENVL